MKSHNSATLTLRDVSSMTVRQRRVLAIWLRQHAKDLVREGEQYASTFRGSFIGRP